MSKMDSEKMRKKLRAKLGIPNPKQAKTNKSGPIIQVQAPRKGCCGR
jgi:hypothetical protein